MHSLPVRMRRTGTLGRIFAIAKGPLRSLSSEARYVHVPFKSVVLILAMASDVRRDQEKRRDWYQPRKNSYKIGDL